MEEQGGHGDGGAEVSDPARQPPEGLETKGSLSPAPIAKGGPISVFILSATEDEAHRRELERHLAPLQQNGSVTVWHSGLIPAGDDVRTATEARLRSARIFLLLVSAAYNEECWANQEQILARRKVVGARVVPILVRSFDWKHGRLAELEPLPHDGRPVTRWEDRDAAWEEVARGVREAVDEERLRPAAAPAPFRDDAELAAAWRAGAEAALVELSEMMKRVFEGRSEAARKSRRTELIIGAVLWSLMLGFAIFLWWEDRSPPTGLLLMLLLLSLAGVVEQIRERRRPKPSARIGRG